MVVARERVVPPSNGMLDRLALGGSASAAVPVAGGLRAAVAVVEWVVVPLNKSDGLGSAGRARANE